MSISERVFQSVAEWSKGQKEFPSCTKDPVMLKAYVTLLLTAKCHDSRLEELYNALWKSYRTILYTYEDELYALKDKIYEFAVECEDIEAQKGRDCLETLEKDHSELKLLFAKFNQLGIYHY